MKENLPVNPIPNSNINSLDKFDNNVVKPLNGIPTENNKSKSENPNNNNNNEKTTNIISINNNIKNSSKPSNNLVSSLEGTN